MRSATGRRRSYSSGSLLGFIGSDVQTDTRQWRRTMIPNRLVEILLSCDTNANARFPPTEVFNEGWMLRLLLDALQSRDISDHPFLFLPGSKWYSEARLASPFHPRSNADSLGEGFTHADGVIGPFDFRASTRAGLELTQGAMRRFTASRIASGSRHLSIETSSRCRDHQRRG